MTLYDDLGVAKDADTATIKRAYRKRAQKAHPDKGGSKEAFHQIVRAYDVLADPKRRAEYDRTGNTGQSEAIETIVLREITSMLFQLVDQVDVEHTNLIEAMRVFVKDKHKTQTQAIYKIEQSIKRRHKVAKRLTRKGQGEVVLVTLINADIEKLRRQIEEIKANAEIGNAILKELDEYKYAVDLVVPPTSSSLRDWFVANT